MKKATKIALITASIFMFCGIAFCVASVATADGNWEVYLDDGNYVKRERTFEAETISGIYLSDLATDIRIEKSDDDALHITYYESEKSYYDIGTDADGTLSVIYHSNRKWYNFIGFHIGFRDYSTVIAIPDGYNGDLTIALASGDLSITDLALSGNLSAKSASGDMEIIGSSFTGEVNLTSASGEIDLVSLTAGDAQISTTSGDVDGRVIVCDALTLSSTSGDLTVQDLSCGELSAKAVSGNIEMNMVTANGNVRCKTTSGEIDLAGITGYDFTLHSTSGSIRAKIRGNENEYEIKAKTTSGSIRVPDTSGHDKTIDVSTTSGNIRIMLTE